MANPPALDGETSDLKGTYGDRSLPNRGLRIQSKIIETRPEQSTYKTAEHSERRLSIEYARPASLDTGTDV
jgi:hypothetical protein